MANAAHLETKRLNEQVRRNLNRFPDAFMFQLNDEDGRFEVANCDLKAGTGWSPLQSLRIHRTRRSDAAECIKF